MQKKLSIIIVSYNTKELLKKCLSLLNTSGDFEIIIVDNASQDNTQMILRMFANNKRIKIILNEKNLGFAKAVNQGIEKAKARFVLLLNPDTEILDAHCQDSHRILSLRSAPLQDDDRKDALEKMINYIERHPEIAAIGPKIRNLDESLQASFGNFPSVITEFFQSFYLHRFFPFGRQICPNIFIKYLFNKPHEVDWLTGACLLIRKKTLDQIGSLDEFYFMGVEDIDWCFRAKKAGMSAGVLAKAGWKMVYYPKVEVLHHHQATTTSYEQAKKRILQENKNLCYFYKKFWPERKIRFCAFKALIKIREWPSLIQAAILSSWREQVRA